MIEYMKGDILKADAEALVNTVNCVGVMGKGIALQFKKAFPDNYKAYVIACKENKVMPGRMFIYETGAITNPRFIINFPTKRHWRSPSRMEDIDSGLIALSKSVKQYEIQSIAIPPLGSGSGGLNWEDVKPRIERAFQAFPNLKVLIYEPFGAPCSKDMVHQNNYPRMTSGRAVLVELINRYREGLLDPFVTLLEIHKLLYFQQEAGEPLRLDYQKSFYGPYAKNLRHVLNEVEGFLLSGYADGGDNPQKHLQLVQGAVEKASDYLQDYPETRERFERVSDLVEGFESPFGLELLSTVYWVIQHESAHSLEDVIQSTYAWNAHKQKFSPRQIKIAVDVLSAKNWVDFEY